MYEYNPIMSRIATALTVLLVILLAGTFTWLAYLGIKKKRKLSEISDRKKGWR
jgi:hypothetical protein